MRTAGWVSVFEDFCLERFRHKHVNNHHNAERQNEQQHLLRLHRVFFLGRFVRHNHTSFAQARAFENGPTVGGTQVT